MNLANDLRTYISKSLVLAGVLSSYSIEFSPVMVRNLSYGERSVHWHIQNKRIPYPASYANHTALMFDDQGFPCGWNGGLYHYSLVL